MIDPMIDPLCENCTYETSEDSLDKETGFCPTCQDAYSLGYTKALADMEGQV